mmetsp:Transcript_50573/g.118819  ORF Transcript_50573/g.118819 Transcript_50573/m.118819 type:complete len:247 (-) Transcript_50573:8-748(-)
MKILRPVTSRALILYNPHIPIASSIAFHTKSSEAITRPERKRVYDAISSRSEESTGTDGHDSRSNQRQALSAPNSAPKKVASIPSICSQMNSQVKKIAPSYMPKQQQLCGGRPPTFGMIVSCALARSLYCPNLRSSSRCSKFSSNVCLSVRRPCCSLNRRLISPTVSRCEIVMDTSVSSSQVPSVPTVTGTLVTSCCIADPWPGPVSFEFGSCSWQLGRHHPTPNARQLRQLQSPGSLFKDDTFLN